MRKLIALTFIAFLSACSAIGINAETPKEKLVVLEYSYQGALKTILVLVNQGLIKKSDIPKISGLIDQAGDSVAAARMAVKMGASNIEQSILLATSLITQLIAYLESKKGKTSWLMPSSPYKLSQRFFKQLVRQVNLSSRSNQSLMLRKLKAGTYRMRNLPTSYQRPMRFRKLSLRS